MLGLAKASRIVFLVYLLQHAAVRVSSSSGDVGSFMDGQGTHVTMVTSHGAVRTQHTEKQDKPTDEYSADDMATMGTDLHGNNDTEESSREQPFARRVKRMISKNPARRWPKAVVPFVFNTALLTPEARAEVRVAQDRWQKYTCVRFVPWVPKVTQQQHGLPDESHVIFTGGKGCNAIQGNIHRANGQVNRCCSRSPCTHEIGHTLGHWHEHQNPLRHGFTRLNLDKADPSLLWTLEAIHPERALIWQYDASSRMHYSSLSGTFDILYEDLGPVVNMGNLFYVFKEFAVTHDCKGLYCSNFTLQCENDGFVTLVDGQCTCLCPPGLDPGTGCTTSLRQVTTSPIWPAGTYSLFAPATGCPGSGVFSTGWWRHWGQGNNRQSSEVNLAGEYTPESFRHVFCTKSDVGNVTGAPEWETGRYCILRAGGDCPDGFQTGYVQFDDAADSPGVSSGQNLPNGDFTTDTRLEFCCRDDGFTTTPMSKLPNTDPLVLFPNKHKNWMCQEIAGMRWSLEFIQFDSFPGLAGFGGEHPYGPSQSKLLIYYCYYVPVNFGCGGELTLTSSNPEVVITSPNFPNPYDRNIECTWMIKTDAVGDNILLNFDRFELTSQGDECQDSLELRYNIAGQPGIRYCGDGLARTFCSLHNVVLLTLRSDHHQVPSGIGFNLTATLFNPAVEQCYDPDTKGVLYRGHKDYTRGMKPCLHWSQVTHCLHHAFKASDFAAGLDVNYCRNPDNTDMPWCYTSADGCHRDYCDVCNIERVYDRSPLCNAATVCNQSRDDIFVVGCAATCKLVPPPAPVRNQTCTTPACVPDAVFPDPLKATYNQGETSTYQCVTGEETANTTCLSNGQWSPIGYVCGGCSPGWAYYRGSCYRLFDQGYVTFATAQQVCRSHGALVTSVVDQDEQDFVISLREVDWPMWIGATDIQTEASFVWQDGTPLNWTNWQNGEPNNYRNEDCVSLNQRYSGSLWVHSDCETDPQALFICKYTLSERTSCRDRIHCRVALEEVPDLCSTHPDFADQQCPYSCGVCLQDSTPRCPTTPPSAEVEVVSPVGQSDIPRGSTVQFACTQPHVLTQGQLNLACDDDGKLIGQLPVCLDPNTLVKDSNDLQMIARPERMPAQYPYLGVGTKLTIQKNGVIKQWRFYSSSAGWSVFQVWRPDPAAGQFSFRLVGQNQVMTQGIGHELYDVAVEDWIHVQPGDRLGLWEGYYASRGNIPHSRCGSGEEAADFGVVQATTWSSTCDYSTQSPTLFSSTVRCRLFSYKAVIHPVSSVPDGGDVATNHISLFPRPILGYWKRLYLSDGDNLKIPTEGYLSRWQFYVQNPGSAALQVWRPRPDLGANSFEFVGQNMFTVSATEGGVYDMTVPEGERIAVRAGDVTGIWYPGADRLGIAFSYCGASAYPESGMMRRSGSMIAESLAVYEILNIPLKTSYTCQTFSFRAVISQDPDRSRCQTAPMSTDVELSQPADESTVPWGGTVVYKCRAGYVLTQGQLLRKCGPDGNLTGLPPVCEDPDTLVQDSNDVALTLRHKLPYAYYTYVGAGTKLTIQRNGVIKQWRFYSPSAGWSVFQVWRPDTTPGQYSFRLLGQNQVLTQGAGEETYDVPSVDWIHVQPGDRLALWEGYIPTRGGVGYSSCVSGEKRSDWGVFRGPYRKRADYSSQAAFGVVKYVFCRVFSYKAVIYPVDSVPARVDMVTNNVLLFPRPRTGSRTYLYLGDGSNFRITVDGFLSEWQFYASSPGRAALQVWRPRPQVGTDKFEFIGQTMLSITAAGGNYYSVTLTPGERIPVKNGDLTGLWYASEALGINFDYCNPGTYPEGSGMRMSSSFLAEDLAASDVVTIPPKTFRTCQVISFRAIVTVG